MGIEMIESNLKNTRSALRKKSYAIFIAAALLFSTAMLSFQEGMGTAFFLVFTIGAFCSVFFPKKSSQLLPFFFIGSLVFLLFLYLGSAGSAKTSQNLWYAGLYVACFLSLFAMSVSLEEALQIFENAGGSQQELQQQEDAKALQQALEKAKSDFSEWKNTALALEQTVSNWKEKYYQMQDDFSQKQRMLQGEKQALEKALHAKKDAVDGSLLEDLSDIKKEKARLQEELQLKEEELIARAFSLNRLKDTEAKYFQLRQQFSEKTTLVETLRGELFHAEEEVLRLTKEKNEGKFLITEEIEQLLQTAFRQEEEIFRLQDTEKELFSLVDALNKQLLCLKQSKFHNQSL